MTTHETLERIYELCYGFELLGAGVLGVLSARRALLRRGGVWPFLTGAFFCIFLADIFYLIVWRLVEFPYVLSAGDLSYLGGLLFLATADIELAKAWPPGESRRPGAVLCSLPLPLLVTAVYAACIRIYPDILVNYLVYLPVLAWLGYASMRHLLAAARAGDRGACHYQLAPLLLVLFHLALDCFSTLGFASYALQETIANGLLVLATLSIYPLAARRYGA